jgi:hypothetical protein
LIPLSARLARILAERNDLTPDETEEIERALKSVRVLEARRQDEAPND